MLAGRGKEAKSLIPKDRGIESSASVKGYLEANRVSVARTPVVWVWLVGSCP
jgi:hypothetical protein